MPICQPSGIDRTSRNEPYVRIRHKQKEEISVIYLNKDSGMAMADILSAISASCNITNVEIRLCENELVATLNVTKQKKSKNGSSVSCDNRPTKQKKGSERNKKIEFNGESLTLAEWASKLGKSINAIRVRVSKYGNPYGMKKPTDEEKFTLAEDMPEPEVSP